jgi:hypothetical protein
MQYQGTSVLDRPEAPGRPDERMTGPAAWVLVPVWTGGMVALAADEAAAVLDWFTVTYRRHVRESATADDLRAELAALLREHGTAGVGEAVRGLRDIAHPDDLADIAWWRAAVARHLAVPHLPGASDQAAAVVTGGAA